MSGNFYIHCGVIIAKMTIYINMYNLKTMSMKKYVCTACNYVYDPAKGEPENGIAPGTAFEDLPEDYACPLCGLGKEVFEEE